MMAPKSSEIIDSNTVKVETAPDGSKILSWEACYRETTVGPSPQGRLEINRIQTPIARRDTGAFNIEVYKDYAY